MRRVVVVGGAGFLGRALVQACVGRGDEVHALDVRSAPRVEIADVTRPGPWRSVLEGADLVVHTAGLDTEAGDAASHWRVHVDSTREVLDAAAAAGAGRLLHLSSTAVHGREFPDGVDETGPVRMTGTPDTDTQVAAEHQVLMAAAAGRVRATIVRLGDVYGPHAGRWTLRPVELLRRGVLVLVDGGHGILSPTYIDDAVRGALAAGDHPDAEGEVFHVTGGEAVEVRDFFGHYARMMNRTLRSLPAGAASALTGPVDIVTRTVGMPSPFTGRSLEYVTHPGTYAIDKIAAVVGWRPSVSLEDGMARTRVWLREAGLVPPPEVVRSPE